MYNPMYIGGDGMAMIRKQIYVTKEIDRRIKAEAKRRGVPESVVIRERLETPANVVTLPDPAAKAALIAWLRKIRAATASGPGTRHKFDREELYAERLEKASPRRHKRPGVRRRSRRTGSGTDRQRAS
jgi:hypothetical protein